MAVFMLNICKFNSCGLTFKSLEHLIQHIEETHIDYDPHVVEKTEQQQPPSIPLSYVLRFLTDAARRENIKPTQHHQHVRPNSNTLATRIKNATPTGSEAEECEDFLSDANEDSNDSWSTNEDCSMDLVYRYNNRNNNQNILSQSNRDDKPFACPIPGCKKRYKNVNGIKYHSKNGHKNDIKFRKAFKCPCGKSYKTPYGLKNHTAIRHNGSVHQIKVVLPNKNPKTHELDSSTLVKKPNNPIITTNLLKMPKIPKVPAIQDHGYMKQECTVQSDTCESESVNNLGILTPASSPPLINSSRVPEPAFQEMKTLQKYLTASSSQTQQNILRCNK